MRWFSICQLPPASPAPTPTTPPNRPLTPPTHPTPQALTSPLSGALGDRYDRAYVVACGCALWGVMTAAIGLSASLGQAMVSCAGGWGQRNAGGAGWREAGLAG